MNVEPYEENLNRKERQISTLINISKILEKERDDFAVILNEAAGLFTGFFKDPENISVNIKISDFDVSFNNFLQENVFIDVPVNYNDECIGEIKISRIELIDDNPFSFFEEERLLKILGSQLGRVSKRLKYQKNLIDARETLKIALTNSKTGIWERNIKNRKVYHSSNIRAILERDAENEEEEFNWLSYVHPEEKSEIEKGAREFVNSKEGIFDLEYRLRTASGEYKWFHDYGKVVEKDSDGNPTRAIGIVRDINKLKETQIKLEEKNRLLRVLSEINQFVVRQENEKKLLEGVNKIIIEYGKYKNCFVGYKDINKDNNIIAVAISGGNKEEAEKYRDSFIGKTSQNSATIKAFEKREPVVISKNSVKDEYELWKELSEKFEFLSSLSVPLVDVVTGDVFGTLSIASEKEDSFGEEEVKIFQEISGDICFAIEQIRRKKELEEMKEMYEKFLDHFPGAVYIKTNESKNVFLNSFFYKYMGASPDWIGKKTSEVFLGQESAKKFEKNDKEAYNRGSLNIFDKIKDASGRMRNFETHKFRIKREYSEDLVGGLSLDITERIKLENERDEAYKRIKNNNSLFIDSIVKIVELRDPYTSGHQRTVALLAVKVGKKMKLNNKQIEAIGTAALLHDIGKIYIPTEILNKSAILTRLEMAMIREHPSYGYDLLKDLNFELPVAEFVLQHHEKIDGSGYPKGLKGDEIHIESKILAVSDVVEAVTSHRPYRPALGVDKAIEIIKEGSGTLFDESVVNACLEVIDEGFKFN